MTIELRSPRAEEEASLRRLFTEAFGDDSFTDLFFHTAYAPERCLAAFDGELLAAAHWFDCTLDGKKAAYLYGIAAFRFCQGRGIGSRLIRQCIQHLEDMGYGVILLVPAEESLFSYYARFGFQTVSTIRQHTVPAGAPLPIRRLTAAAYADARRALLPAHSLLQEGACLELLSGYAGFYATDHALAAASEHMVWEFLGDEAELPGLLAALGLDSAPVRTPRPGRPFAMAIGIDGPIYLGLALD